MAEFKKKMASLQQPTMGTAYNMLENFPGLGMQSQGQMALMDVPGAGGSTSSMSGGMGGLASASLFQNMMTTGQVFDFLSSVLTPTYSTMIDQKFKNK